ncbi:MAG: hypothetical protein ACKVWR_21835 [Acidimicrobiales bacterium]
MPQHTLVDLPGGRRVGLDLDVPAAKQRRESVALIRRAWEGRHRQPRRARIVIRANVGVLRALDYLGL